jgi:hypothetical protein
MKRMTILLSIVGLLFAAGAEIAAAQSVHTQDVLDSTLVFGDPWGPARYQRCQAALRHGWGNASSCDGFMTVPRYARAYNNRRGGFFNRGGRNMNYGRGGRWPSVAAQGIQTVGDVIMSSQNNGTIREVERGRNRLEQQRIDGDQEIARRQEDRADRRLGMEERQQDYELKQLEGHYTAKQVGSISQPSETNRTLYNNSSCEISVYRNGRLKFTLPPQESILIPNLTYEWEADGCNVQVGEITISSPRR